MMLLFQNENIIVYPEPMETIGIVLQTDLTDTFILSAVREKVQVIREDLDFLEVVTGHNKGVIAETV